MYQALIVIHVIVAASLIGLVLIQHGKGADAGAAFGSGSSSTVFGARGSASFLTRLTAVLAAGFFFTSLAVGYLTLQINKPDDSEITDIVSEDKPVTPASDIPDAPAAPVPGGDSDIPVVPEKQAMPEKKAAPEKNKAAPTADAPAKDAVIDKIPE